MFVKFVLINEKVYIPQFFILYDLIFLKITRKN